MVSKRIKYARAHLSRRRHIAILATPLWRRTQKGDFNILPRPFSVPRAALKAHATKRIKTMSQPKLVQRKFEAHPAPSQTGHLRAQRQQQQQAETGDLGSGEPNKRIADLSLPKKSILLHARRFVISAANRNLLNNISSTLEAIRKSRYQKYRVICNSLAQRAAAREAKMRKKLHRVLNKPADWERHEKILKVLAAPKLVPKPPRPKRPAGRRRLFDPAHTSALAQPAVKDTDDAWDPFAVQPSALVYNITERMEKLASVEEREEPSYLEPGRVSPSALHFTATERLLKLAEPAQRQTRVETDERENVFAVLPRALKAICRARVKELAKPKHRVRRRL